MKEYARNIKLHSGDDETLAVRIRDNSGEIYELTGCTGKFQLKHKYDDAEPIITKYATFEKWSDKSNYIDTCLIELSHIETKTLVDYNDLDELGDVRPVYGVYDLEIKDENNEIVQILYGGWVAVAEVTR